MYREHTLEQKIERCKQIEFGMMNLLGAYQVLEYPEFVTFLMEVGYEADDDEGDMDYISHSWAVLRESDHVILQKYSCLGKKLADYMIFYLSATGVIPNLGKLYVCKEIYCSDWNDIMQISSLDDAEYPQFCENYKKKLFHLAGWTISENPIWEKEDYRCEITIPTWDDEVLEYRHEDEFRFPYEKGVYYEFHSKIAYNLKILGEIFHYFNRGGHFAIVDDDFVVIFMPIQCHNYGVSIDNDWTEVNPMAALCAWRHYQQKQLECREEVQNINQKGT